MTDLTSFIKNPIVLAIIAGALTYLVLWWNNDRMYKKDPNIPKKDVNLLIPVSVAIIVALGGYFLNKGGSTCGRILGNDTRCRLASSDSASFHMLKKNNLNALPPTDVFIDIARF